MINLVMLAILVGVATQASPESTAAPEPTEVMTAGFGAQSSCASWKRDDSQGSIWILGYWSGRNVEAEKGIGSTTDADGILDEVRLICKSQPSLPLLDAVAQVYHRFVDEQR